MAQNEASSGSDPAQVFGFGRPHPGREARIVHLTAEYWPYIRTGGLGEAVRGMATFQARAGSETSVILPLYKPILEKDYGLRPVGEEFSVQVGPRSETGRLWEATSGTEEARVFFIENELYFGRPGVYGEKGAGTKAFIKLYSIWIQFLFISKGKHKFKEGFYVKEIDG
ncbi:MAG: glycogen/starch synthase, partial [Longimicrobiales bacterium]